MRERDLRNDKDDSAPTAIIRRERTLRRLRFETGDTIRFDAAAFRLDRSLGIPEHTAVMRNLTIIPAWPEVIITR
ncbi:MAG: hypothetical protein KF736_04885 [Acidobacteria bacterium]|nr:hypothetical protein [Acidobacteriota bacterium]MCW5948280.1 hypothetical protein [Pyrinomonadaceae bacterium]